MAGPPAHPGADDTTARDPDLATLPEGDDPDRIVAFSARALGSRLILKVRFPAPVDADARAAAGRAWDAVRAEFDAVDVALSRFRDDSEITWLNRLAGTGRVVRVSWRTRRTLAALDRAERVTDGRFDPAVLGSLERIGEHGAALADLPGTAAGDPASEDPAAGLGPVVHDGRAPSPVHVPARPVDTGGIGKGLALRWARDRALAELPAEASLLLDAGGDLVAGGAVDDGWEIGIEDPIAPDVAAAPPVALLWLAAGGVATSSVRVRRWTSPDGTPVHHLIDPATGDPARTGLIAVTVAGPDPAWAEVWSKALFLAGRDAIADEARIRGIAAWWVDDRGRLGLSPDARLRTIAAQEARVGEPRAAGAGSAGPFG